MKFKLYTMLSIALGYTALYPLNDYTNQTNMFVRPVFDSISIEQAGWHNILYQKQKNGGALQAIAMYAQTYENLETPAYFLFDYKNKINVSAGTPSIFQITGPGAYKEVVNPAEGQINVVSLSRDVLGQTVGINSGNDYFFSLNPEVQQACGLIEYSHDLKHFFSWWIFENWYLNASLPITWVRNNLGVNGDQPAIEAFDQCAYKFVRFAPCSQDSLRLTLGTIALGTRYISDGDVQVITTSGIIVPFVPSAQNTYVFAPMQGFNGHWGFDTQVHFQFPVVEKFPGSRTRVLFFADVHNNFLARNYQYRTYDIWNKPFSRYLQLLDRKTNKLVPAMNALTLRSRIEPYNIVNFMTGFRFAHNDSCVEFGYELWAHQSERITPQPQPGHSDEYFENDRYGIAFINTDGVLAQIDPATGAVEPLTPGVQGQTASHSTINFISAPDGITCACATTGDVIFQPINKYLTLNDLDFVSPASRSTITHRAFLSATAGETTARCKYYVNFGAYIEAAQNNAALCFWGGWLKGGLSF